MGGQAGVWAAGQLGRLGSLSAGKQDGWAGEWMGKWVGSGDGEVAAAV